MDKLALYGLFNENVIRKFKEEFAGEFEVVEVNREGDLNAIADAKIIINRVFHMDAKVFDSAKDLKMVQKWGAGTDKLDVTYAGYKGIPVVNCVGINAVPVAEMAVLLMLAVYRHILPQTRRFADGEWPRDEYAKQSYLINGKTIGLLGFGRIGQQVCRIVHDGFGANVQYYDYFRQSEEREREIGVAYVDMDTLLRTSDIVSIHLPLTDCTNGMIGAELLRKMKPSAVLINTARGGLVDEPALIEALRTGVIAAAGLDTFSEEPLPSSSDLLKLENVVATPHCAGNTADNDLKMIECCVRSIRSFTSGERPSGAQLVNKEALGW